MKMYRGTSTHPIFVMGSHIFSTYYIKQKVQIVSELRKFFKLHDKIVQRSKGGRP